MRNDIEWSLDIHAVVIREVTSGWSHPSPDFSGIDNVPLLARMSTLLDNSNRCSFTIIVTIDGHNEVGVSVVVKIVSCELPHLIP